MSNTNHNVLTAEESYVIENKGTEPAFAGEYDDFYQKGVYRCRRCDAELYRSDDKFDAHCGWPAFDQEIPRAVRHLPARNCSAADVTRRFLCDWLAKSR